ncbi:MAG TPA: TIGR02300 family protein [Rhodospirillaceae bacterium]|nr:TIGR02300 family protein [Rhodospirillaceae bacterium]
MTKPEWGLKRICPNCAARYYDMKKKPPVCPSCGTAIAPETLSKSRRARAPIEEKTVKPKPTPEEDLENIAVDKTDADDDSIIEDAGELGEDSLDVKGAIELEPKEKDDQS